MWIAYFFQKENSKLLSILGSPLLAHSDRTLLFFQLKTPILKKVCCTETDQCYFLNLNFLKLQTLDNWYNTTDIT